MTCHVDEAEARHASKDAPADVSPTVPPPVAMVFGEEEAVLVVSDGACVHVNGEIATGRRTLLSGDVVGLGGSSIVFQRREDVRHGMVLSPELLRARLAEETERALRYKRPLAVLYVDFPSGLGADPAALTDELRRTVRSVDIAGWGPGNGLAVLMPETATSALVPAQRILDQIAPHAPRARVGIALCPMDACDPDALLAAACNAARTATAGSIAPAGERASTIKVGEQTYVAADPKTQRLFELLARLAPSDIPVLVTGETGAGKEVVAATLHAWSKRRAGPIVAINCAAVAETLLESELFGHERGAFSGAVAAKPGLLETAQGGTLLLDEVGECSPRTQAKLLRVLETRRVARVGSVTERAIDVRLVAATNRDLSEEVEAGHFRRDLFFRLSGAAVVVPPLRERPLDVPLLARTFLEEACRRLGRAPLLIAPETMEAIALHAWPGNVRELRNAMDYAATVDSSTLTPSDLPPTTGGPMAESARMRIRKGGHHAPMALYEELRTLERARIREALVACGGVRVRAAELLGLPLRTLVTKLKEYDLADAVPRRTRRA